MFQNLTKEKSLVRNDHYAVQGSPGTFASQIHLDILTYANLYQILQITRKTIMTTIKILHFLQAKVAVAESMLH